MYTQDNRPLSISTGLGKDVLLLEGFRGTAAISELFRFELALLAEKRTRVPFEQLLGQPVSVRLELADGSRRHFHGIMSHLAKARGGEAAFDRYRAEMVPALWLLTRRRQCRVFQQRSVPDILKEILAPLRPNVQFIMTGAHEPREYCVQYRESDYDFACRLMEEDGLCFGFEHAADKHVLVVVDSIAALPAATLARPLRFQTAQANEQELVVTGWEKHQEVRASEFALWDQHFELTGQQGRFQNLEGRRALTESVKVGSVEHRLRLLGNELEDFDYPGGYAHHFDGVQPTGSDDAAALSKVHAQAKRAASLRMEAEAAQAVWIDGESNCGHLEPGYTFQLTGAEEDDGAYLVRRVQHQVKYAGYRSGADTSLRYDNQFECAPEGLPYRSPRRTPRPVIAGVQTATVVGIRDGQPFVDKYGRIKVQFHWDRAGKFDAGSSCWVRVAQVWAGNRWGAFFWPRPGQEVVVSFSEGDPDKPLITGSVYNAANMPPFPLPEYDSACGIKSSSIGGDPLKHFNCVIFHDALNDEHLQIHSETREALTSESARYNRTPGPSYEFVGDPARLSAPGSGSGAGLMEFIGYGSMAANLFGAKFLDPLLAAFAGKSTWVCGDRVDATFWGSHVKHVFAGADAKSVYDLEGILWDLEPISIFGQFAKWMEWKKAADAALGVHGLLGLAGAFGGGKSSFTAGPACNQVYWGPKIDIARCNTFQYKGKPFFQDWDKPGRAARLLAVGVMLLTLTCDVLAYIIDQSGDLKNDKERVAPLQMFLSVVGSLTARLQGIMVLIDTLCALGQTAQAKQTQVDAETSLAKRLDDVSDTLKVVSSGIQTVKEGLESVAIAAGQPQGTKQIAHDSHVYQGSYTLNATDLALVSKDDTGASALVSLDTSRGKGLMDLASSHTLSLSAGKSSSITVSASGQFTIKNKAGGTLTLQGGLSKLGPRIELTDKHIQLSIGAATLELEPTALQLKLGPYYLKMSTLDGIELKAGPSGLQLDPKLGIFIKGLKGKDDGGLNKDIDGVNATLGSGGFVRLDAALKNV